MGLIIPRVAFPFDTFIPRPTRKSIARPFPLLKPILKIALIGLFQFYNTSFFPKYLGVKGYFIVMNKKNFDCPSGFYPFEG